MPKLLYVKGTDTCIAEVDDRQFEVLARALQTEGPADRDYFLNEGALRLLEARGCDRTLVARLRSLFPGRAGRAQTAPTQGAFRDRYRPDEELVPGPSDDAGDDEEGIDIEWREA